jgi:NADH dehydrogenase
MRVVVVGGGFGGVKTALELANKQNIQVTLIAPTGNFEYHGALYRSATGRSPLEVVIRIADIFSSCKNITFVLDAVVSIDEKRNMLVGSTGIVYDYDAVVFAMGNQVNYFGIEGMADYAATMTTVPAAIDLRTRLVGLAKNSLKSPNVNVLG